MVRPLPYVTLAVILCLLSCRERKRSGESVEAAMKKYDQYILKMDVDSIAWIYTPDGELGNVAKGRDSIRKFLEKFKNYKVISQISSTNTIAVSRDTALQTGTYEQKVIISPNDTVTVKGLFMAKWFWLDSTGWHIKHLETKSSR